VSKKLSASEYREALILLLAELEDLDLQDPLGTAERLGRLRGHARTIAGIDPLGIEPIYGLTVLRRLREVPADGAEPDRAAEYERARRAALTRERLEGASGEVRPDE
jgi:ribosomal protein L29